MQDYVFYVYLFIMTVCVLGAILKLFVFSKIYGTNKEAINKAIQDKILEAEFKRNKYQKN